MQVARQHPLHRLPVITKTPSPNLNELTHNHRTSPRTQSAKNQEQEILQFILKQPTPLIRPLKVGITEKQHALCGLSVPHRGEESPRK